MKILKSNILNNYIFINKTIYNYSKLYYFISILRAIISGFTPIINIVFPKIIIDNFTSDKGFNKIIFIVGLWLVIDLIIIIIFKYIDKFLSIRKDFLNNHFIFSVYEKMVQLDMSYLEDPSVYDLKQKAIDVVSDDTARNFCSDIFKTISLIISIVSTFIILTTLDVVVFVILLAILLFNISLIILQKKEKYSFWDSIVPLNKKTEYYLHLLSDPVYSKEMKMYSISKWIMNKYREVKYQFFKLSKTLYNKILTLNGIQDSIRIFQRSLIYIYLSFKMIFKKMTFGNFTLYFSALNTFSSNISSFINIFLNIAEKSVYIGAYKKFLELENIIANDKIAESKQDVDYVLKKIVFKNVTFSYPGRSEKVLKNINITLDTNKFYIIAGHNGAGKTTLINLLCRLYDPTSGSILLNNKNIIDLNYKQYRNLFGVVFQDYKYYGFTIAENIAMNHYSKEEKNIERIHKSINNAGLSSKIESLPKGMFTYLSKMLHSDAIELSGGESQKLALAKALYKDAKILILDEPSSALDPLSEDELLNIVKNISVNKTIIYISHRLSTAIYADKVIYMENSKISAFDTHENLMRTCSSYANMFNVQAKKYKESNYKKL